MSRVLSTTHISDILFILLSHCFSLSSNRAECHLRKTRYQEVIRDTTLALAQGFQSIRVYVKTMYRRAKAFYAINRPFEALGMYFFQYWAHLL